MVQLPTKTLTLEEFLKLPETKPASEYINGQIIQKPMPQGKHSILQGELVSSINAVVKPKKTALAFPELRCTFGGRSIVPDVAVFAWKRIPIDENGDIANVFKAAPDWIIEILSPDQSPTKVIGNILHCLKQGCRMGWLIDPDERSLLIYPPGQQPEILQEEQEILPVPDLFGNLQLTVGQLFGLLKL
ncbi:MULTISPECIES: Uma2 family endonuclease [Fischerella]|uniref:Uma2 family endonuclease n=1 Tax=Fischerella muscicola CCMEE 5323 TaxID=2019572 RepID=A0A2N6JWA4_FISMU|nr:MULTISPECIES: Uma2 family endonuclease [Fischerella]MBD2433401.1 Uma2 family endonuclease [Fischerella sp. FACHB-380]PLZ84324.1 Uma2 family endonuclease [Fischerella muscicola CCMEE 5323]